MNSKTRLGVGALVLALSTSSFGSSDSTTPADEVSPLEQYNQHSLYQVSEITDPDLLEAIRDIPRDYCSWLEENPDAPEYGPIRHTRSVLNSFYPTSRAQALQRYVGIGRANSFTSKHGMDYTLKLVESCDLDQPNGSL